MVMVRHACAGVTFGLVAVAVVVVVHVEGGAGQLVRRWLDAAVEGNAGGTAELSGRF